MKEGGQACVSRRGWRPEWTGMEFRLGMAWRVDRHVTQMEHGARVDRHVSRVEDRARVDRHVTRQCPASWATRRSASGFGL